MTGATISEQHRATQSENKPGNGRATNGSADNRAVEGTGGVTGEEQTKGRIGGIGRAGGRETREDTGRAAEAQARHQRGQQDDKAVGGIEEQESGKQDGGKNCQKDAVDAEAVGGRASKQATEGIAEGRARDGEGGDPEGKMQAARIICQDDEGIGAEGSGSRLQQETCPDGAAQEQLERRSIPIRTRTFSIVWAGNSRNDEQGGSSQQGHAATKQAQGIDPAEGDG